MLKIELKSDDALALKHMGNALTGMYRDLTDQVCEPEELSDHAHLGMKPTSDDEPTHVDVTDDDNDVHRVTFETPIDEDVVITMSSDEDDDPIVEEMIADLGKPASVEQYEQLAEDASATPPPPPMSAELDSNGAPWDGRIHSKNKTKIGSGSWKLRKRPTEFTAEEWSEHIKTIHAECMQALSGDPIVEVDDTPQPSPSDLIRRHSRAIPSDTPPPPAELDDTPPPPAELDDTPAPPPAELDDTPQPPAELDANVTFPDLMKLITGNSKNDSLGKVTAILNGHGVAKLALLNTVRPDLVPTVYNELKTELGL